MRPALPLLFALSALHCAAQTPITHKVFNHVMPIGVGRIVIPSGDDIQWKLVNLFDNGTRPVFQIENKVTGLITSYILFANSTHSTAPKICRDDVLQAAMSGVAPPQFTANIKQVKKSESTTKDGRPVSLGSFFVASVMDMKLAQQNEFAVMASPTVCAEMHVSLAPYQSSDSARLSSQIETFDFDSTYVPTVQDYATLGSIFFTVIKSYPAAASYYQSAFDILPENTDRNTKRFLVDQLAMSYGISGQIKQSRAVNEAAIKSDPEYPLYYYNLACADAEQHKAADAKVHLQQAFERKANTLPGEHLPDPAQDDSIQKLKKNKDFWAFVQTLK